MAMGWKNRPVKAEMQFLWPPENETKVWSELHFTNTLIINILPNPNSLLRGART